MKARIAALASKLHPGRGLPRGDGPLVALSGTPGGRAAVQHDHTDAPSVIKQTDRYSVPVAQIRIAPVVQADVGDGRQDPALADRAGDSDAVTPVEHVVPAAAPVQVHRIHSAAGPDLGGYALKPGPGRF